MRLPLLLTGLTLLAACGATPSVGDVPSTAEDREVQRLVNAARATTTVCPLAGGGSRALAPAPSLAYNALLENAAAWFARDMALHGYFAFDHISRDGRTAERRIVDAGYAPRVGVTFETGENLAAGPTLTTPSSAVAAWLASPEHCPTLMDPLLKDVGVGHAQGAQGHVWVLTLGAR